jgi:aspartate aminotransferase-like enzyme
MDWLLTPGPVRLHPKALEALARPQLHHRTEAAREVFLKARGLLREAFRTEGEVLILTGSGTLAMEALVKNLFAPGERVLVPVYGKFSERFYEIALEAGLVVERLDYPYGDTPRPEDVAKEGYAGLLLVHSETSTGALADLPALARAFKEKNPEGLVGADMVTSLLVGEVALEAMGVDAAASGSQKGLMCPPGLGFVALSPRALERLKPRGYYLDLARELKAQAEREAELLRKEAQAAKERLLQEAAQELKRLRAEIERARQEKALFLGQVRALFEGYLEALKRLEKTP